MKKSQIFAVRSEVCYELENNLRYAISNIDDCKTNLTECGLEMKDYYSEELEKAQLKVKIYKEILDKIDTIKAD